jgi:alpha-1,2-mannosyltransferase
LISDSYWKHFTLLGQSLGSVVLAWEGLCGKDGLWGDIFLGELSSALATVQFALVDSTDSMGYAFTLPFVRLIAGEDIAIGAYVHYPTVSADMVKRVRERMEGVENAGASKSWLRTRVKLLCALLARRRGNR